MVPRPKLALVGLLLVASLSLAQGRGGGFHGSPPPGFAGGRHGASSFAHRAGTRGNYYGAWPLFYDDPLYDYSQSAPDSAPPMMFMQPPAAAASPQPKLSPLVIQLEGDHYVRYGGTVLQTARLNNQGLHNEGLQSLRPPEASTNNSAPSDRNIAASLLPTVLVFRDGHQEEVPDYVIIGRTIYAHTNDVEAGYAMKNIQLSSLDLLATVKANRAHGVDFVLPGGPNEVVTRP